MNFGQTSRQFTLNRWMIGVPSDIMFAFVDHPLTEDHVKGQSTKRIQGLIIFFILQRYLRRIVLLPFDFDCCVSVLSKVLKDVQRF